VTNNKIPVIYIDHTILALISTRVSKDDPMFEDWHGASMLWRKLREETIRIVTHGKDTEMDIILWLNRQGCCITDTLRALEAIKEFELWGKDEKGRIQQYKKILAHFEELELLQRSSESEEKIQKIEEVLKLKITERAHGMDTEACLIILRRCLADLGSWYTQDLWSDLKRTDYQLNWQILESALSREGIEPAYHGDEGTRNRYLFGLFNRAVGIAKKSYGKLPIPDSLINFVVAMVLQKYGDDQASRGLCHLLHCVNNQIEFYVTANRHLIQGFSSNRTAIQEYLQLPSLTLVLLGPQRFISEVLGGDVKR
jgi:hypothetical protein